MDVQSFPSVSEDYAYKLMAEKFHRQTDLATTNDSSQESAQTESLEHLFHKVVAILQDDQAGGSALGKCKETIEGYRGTDWILYSRMPESKGSKCFGYSRTLVHTIPDVVTLLILTWSPHSESAIHNHPCDKCFLMPLQGDFKERRVGVSDDGNDVSRLDEMGISDIPIGEAAWIDDSHGWHAIINSSSSLAVSMHFYIPPWRSCKIIEPDFRHISEVTCCAHMPNVEKSLTHRVFSAAHACFQLLGTTLPSETLKDAGEQKSCHQQSGEDNKMDLSLQCGGGPVDDDTIFDSLSTTLKRAMSRGTVLDDEKCLRSTDPLAVAVGCLKNCVEANLSSFESSPVLLQMEQQLLRHMAYFLGWCESQKSNCSQSGPRKFSDGDSTTTSNQTPPNNKIVYPKSVERRSDIGSRHASVVRGIQEEYASPPEEQRNPRFSSFDAVMTTGSAMSAGLAVAVARDHKFPDAKTQGLFNLPPLCIFTSAQSHESILTAAAMSGIGVDNVISVSTNANDNAMDLKQLISKIAEARHLGKIPLLLNCTAGTALTGAFDPFNELADIARQEDMWMHVDGSIGGSFLLPQNAYFTSVCSGIARADSFSWDLHTLLGIPSVCSALLSRHPGVFSSGRIHQDVISTSSRSPISYAACADSFKAWCVWRKLGDLGMANRVRFVRTHSKHLAELVQTFPKRLAHRGPTGDSADVQVVEVVPEGEGLQPRNINLNAFQLVWQPTSYACCFWWIPYDLRGAFAQEGYKDVQVRKALNRVAPEMRARMLAEGLTKIDHYAAGGRPSFWCITLLNPGLSRAEMFRILQTINKIGDACFPPNTLA